MKSLLRWWSGSSRIRYGHAPKSQKLEIAATFIVAAVAIEFDSIAGAFTRRAAVFATFLWGARTNRVLALLWVCHLDPPEDSLNWADRVAQKSEIRL